MLTGADPETRIKIAAKLQTVGATLQSKLNQLLTTYNACVIKGKRGPGGQNLSNMEYVVTILELFTQFVNAIPGIASSSPLDPKG